MKIVMCAALLVVLAAPASAQQSSNPVVVFQTVKGTFEIELYPAEAPKSVELILSLVKNRYYNGLRVHRLVQGFVVQWGDPQTRDMSKKALWGNQGSGREVGVNELSAKRPHRVGAVGLAHGGDPRTFDGQIYVALSGLEEPRVANIQSLGRYPIVGQVISGMDVVRKLQVPDVIKQATVKAPKPVAK
jgi:cyclophilin family peptidyl-prolyl cis-trans isomerase